MSHLLRRTKKSCLKLLRKISTSKQLFVQRLDEDIEDEEEQDDEELEERQQGQQMSCSLAAANDKQYSMCYQQQQQQQENHNNPEPSSVQCLEYACEAAILEEEQLDIKFDLMHYKENVRYLRHTPSNSSLDLQLDPQQQQEHQQQQQQLPSRDVPAPRACSVSVGSKFDGNYHNVIIMEQPPNDDYPIVKWDINGNSLDEEHFDLRQHWDAFDNRWRQLQSAQSKRLGSAQSQRSSHHSSSCTLETWIDDAEMGQYDDSQNLLQTNNNCNHCLRSF
ncbi:hypothetical protein KR093_002656 [Drosophila rubida]|uniref:Mediator of RNA polymerase II transcription subunit 26 n=1 Tax=Drosophila rubida TaxID=30044 RepID=A0AAD4JYB1_9MUSC|nr:hypothetical protein KR093_002656 [Drosophila rubida]